MRRASETLKRVLTERDGAIMIMGTWMSFGLIGVTWYVIGVGDALVYRDHVQEAADSVAFSAAVVHAKGMNFIAAINLIMMMLVSLFLLIRIFEDFLWQLIKWVVGSTDPKCDWGNPLSQPGCCDGAFGTSFPAEAGFAALGIEDRCAIAAPINDAHKAVKEVRLKYEGILDKVLPVLGKTERITKNIVTPAGAFVAGVYAGHEYGETGIPISAAMIPAGAGGVGGLPLESKKFHDMCSHVAGDILNWVEGKVVDLVPPLGGLLETPPISWGVDKVKEWISGTIANRYCPEEDDDYGETPFAKGEDQDGFYVVRDGVPNGDDRFQIWSFVHGTKTDPYINIVPFGTHWGHGAAGVATKTAKQNTAHTYTAEAEYYFDCSAGWEDSGCNENDDAMFSMEWKARLRRVHSPSIGADLAGEVNGIINENIDEFTNKDLEEGEGLGSYVGDQAVGWVLGEAAQPVEDGISAAGNAALPGGYKGGVFH